MKSEIVLGPTIRDYKLSSITHLDLKNEKIKTFPIKEKPEEKKYNIINGSNFPDDSKFCRYEFSKADSNMKRISADITFIPPTDKNIYDPIANRTIHKT